MTVSCGSDHTAAVAVDGVYACVSVGTRRARTRDLILPPPPPPTLPPTSSCDLSPSLPANFTYSSLFTRPLACMHACNHARMLARSLAHPHARSLTHTLARSPTRVTSRYSVHIRQVKRRAARPTGDARVLARCRNVDQPLPPLPRRSRRRPRPLDPPPHACCGCRRTGAWGWRAREQRWAYIRCCGGSGCVCPR